MKAISKKLCSTLLGVFSLALFSYAQSAYKYSYQIKSPKPLNAVIEDLKVNYGLQFSYPSEIISRRELSKNLYQSNKLSSFLEDIFEDVDLDYQIVDGHKILLRPDRSIDLMNYENYPPVPILVKGYIQDSKGTPLSFVDVALDTLFLGDSSDDSGYFEFEIPGDLQDHVLSFHLLGYETNEVLVETFLSYPKINLQDAALDLDEVLVVERIPSISINPVASSTSAEVDFLTDVTSASILSNDIIRGVQFLAGVSATNDLSSEIKIRGSQGDETLIMLDGIPIYKADHYYGIFGAINGNFVNKVALHKNSMPVQYGGKTGGMLEMYSKDYFQSTEGIADANMLTSSFTLSTPINDQWSFTASARSTYDNAANSKIFSWIEPNPSEEVISKIVENSDRPLVLQISPVVQFYDLNAKVLFKPKEGHQASFSFFNGKDKFRNNYDIGFEEDLRMGKITGLEIYDDNEDWTNLGMALGYSGKTLDDWTYNTSIHYSSHDYNSTLSTSIDLQGAFQRQFALLSNTKSNDIADVGGSLRMSKDFANHSIGIGLSGVQHDLHFFFQTDDVVRFDQDVEAFEGALFGTYDWRVDKNWNLHLGSRLDYYSETDQFYFGPRIYTSYKASNDWTLKGAFSKNYQFVREITHYTRLREPIDIFMLTTDVGNGRKYPVGTSTNLMSGATFIKNNWALDLEVYHKDLGGVVEQTQLIVGKQTGDLKPSEQGYQTLNGIGKSFGVDVSLGFEKKGYAAWMAYTLSKTMTRFEEISNDEWFLSQDDRRHQLKFSNEYKLDKWQFTGNYVFGSGRNFIDLSKIDGTVDLRNTSIDQIYSQLDPYHRIDLGISYGFELLESKASVGIKVINALNHNNVDYIQYLFTLPRRGDNNDDSTVTGSTSQLLDRTFNLSFEIEW